MPIRAITIESDAEKQVLVMAGHHRLADVMAVFTEREYALNAAYLVLCEADEPVRVMSFLELQAFWADVGAKLVEMPLAEWDMREASRVWVNEEIESGREVIEWVARHPGSNGVVIDEQGKFVCLFTNPNLSKARTLDSSLPRLHGELADLYNDLRRLPPSLVKRATLPHCSQKSLYLIIDEKPTCKNQECGKDMG